LGRGAITPELTIHVEHVKRLQAKFQIANLQVLLAIWAPIETQGRDSLYRALFLNGATHRRGTDAAFEQAFPDSEVLTDSGETLQPHLPLLRGAFRVSAHEMDLMLADCALQPATATLDLNNLSALFRRAALAKAQRLSVKDFLSLKTVSGDDPFASPEATERFAEVSATIAKSGLTQAQLDYLLRHIAANTRQGQLEPGDSVVAGIASTLRNGLTAIVRANAIAADPDGTLTAQKLATLYDGDVVNEFIGVVNGTVNYSASLITLPAGVAIPVALTNKLGYDPIAQLLTCKSPLTAADRSMLLALSTDPSYQAAIKAVYQQPLDLIHDLMHTFADAGEAQKTLVAESASVGPDLKPILLDAHGAIAADPTQAQTTVIATKFAHILKALLPHLIVRQSAALIETTLSSSLKIADSMAQQLVEKRLRSRLDHRLGAMHDCHSLQQPGLSAAYFTSSDLSGPGTFSIVHTVSFDGLKKMLRPGTSSASWSGMVAAPQSGDFVFFIRTSAAPTLWVDDKSTPLTLVQAPVTGEWIAEKIALKAGQLYYLRLDALQLPVSNAAVSLLWESPTVRKAVVPKDSLYPSSVLDAFRETYILLHKAALIINALQLSVDEIRFLAEAHEGLPCLDFNALPVARDPSTAGALDQAARGHFIGLLRASRLAAFRQALPASEVSLTQLFTASTMSDAVGLLARLTGWNLDVLQDLIGPNGFALEAMHLRNELWPIRLMDCMALIGRLGIAPADLFRWSTVASDFETLESIGNEVKHCVQAQYDAETWLTIVKPLNDRLRDGQRNALVAYLLPRMGMKDAGELFEYFLIDAQMGACTETSRISLAHSTVQTFVQRCLMNLEESDERVSVSPHQIDSNQWEQWRKHYRFWQANYEVLLTPEKWMQQSLRDDKTPFFQELEGDLSQAEITADNVETAYLNYLEKLERVARLEVIGTFWQDADSETGEHVDILHVFGRTFHTPHTYFYRTFVSFTTWTPWQEMQVTIDGDHLMPVIWNRKLYLFWPVFLKKAAPPDHPKSIDATSTSIPMKDGQSYWQVSLAWSVLQQNKWTAKQISRDAFDMDPKYYVEDEPSRYAKFAYSFKTSIAKSPDPTSASLLIRCVFDGATVTNNPLGWLAFDLKLRDATEVVGAFEVGGCSGESIEAVFGTMPWPDPLTPPGMEVEALTYVQSKGAEGLTLFKAGNQQPSTYLHHSPTQYRLLYPHQFSDYLLQAPLFYQDKHCSYFVSPAEAGGAVHHVTNPEHAAFHRDHLKSLSRAKSAASLQAPERLRSHGGEKGSHSPRHSEAGEVSEELLAIERKLADFGEPFASHASGQDSAWGSHALEHAHAPAASHLRFEPFYHSFVCDFMKSVSRLGVAGLLTEANQRLTAQAGAFEHDYEPTGLVARPLPLESVDFGSGPYAIYNQELFFHIPDLIAENLLQNQRYDDAIRWWKFIFDPADDGKDEPPPDRYWQYVPFKASARDNIQKLIGQMESGDQQHSQLIADWARNPFQPFAIARHRPEAYKKNIFMKYVRTQLQQGDSLFLTDLKEAVNEAEQHYLIAAHLLGPRPENLSARVKPKPECYATLRDKLDVAAGMMILLENEFPFSGKVATHPRSDSGGIQNLGRTLYFCTPKNDELDELWDTVDDRLYKIRNCQNFAGVFRQLSLFDPPIDPGLLVRAAALGLDLGSVLADIQSPLPAYRFSYMLQKAMEMCNECRAFGGALLSALEKNDAEALAVMRSTHEVGMLELMLRVKVRQVDEANAQIDALNGSRVTAAQRYGYYQTLVGVTGGSVPAPGANVPLIPVPSQPSVDVFGIQLIPEEGIELTLSTAASIIQIVSGATQAVATALHEVPQVNVHAQPMGVGVTVSFGGQNLGPGAESGASALRIVGECLSAAASLSGKMGTYFRRQAEWVLQNNLAACEIMQIDKQIAAANIRVDIAQRELESQQKQMENAQTILDYMTNKKFTNQDLYSWMVSDTSSSYFACYQMAFSLAKKAERTFRFERGLTESNFIQFGYWESMRKGLLAGDRLHLALLQMESAYTDLNVREYEIARDLSLLLNAPLALIALKETGICEIAVPESFFDSDYPGHYMRRLKSVSLSIPCVVGPYTSLNCTLTLLTNKTRVSNDLGDQYAEDVKNGDARFVTNFAAVQSIATSHGSNDGGLFEVNFRDERYLPFEGAGIISRWRVEMPKENNAFDFDTISDVILHMKYTARDGGDPLRRAARQALALNPQNDLLRLFSIRHEFPSEWFRLFSSLGASASEGPSAVIELSGNRFPFAFRGKTISINRVDLFFQFKEIYDRERYSVDGTPLGEYASAKPLTLKLTPPDQTGLEMHLKSDRSILNGIPHASMNLSDLGAAPGGWTISAKNEDIAALPPSLLLNESDSKIPHINGAVIADIFLVCHYLAN
jgi:hypothetical protein